MKKALAMAVLVAAACLLVDQGGLLKKTRLYRTAGVTKEPTEVKKLQTDPTVAPGPSLWRQIIEQRVVDLPEDSGKYWMTMFMPKDPLADREAARVVGWFESNPDLNYMASSGNMRTSFLAPDSRQYTANYGHRSDLSVDKFPILIIQTPDGRVIYKASRGNFPASGRALFRELAISIEQCQPRPNPRPGPNTPTPGPNTVVNPLPDKRPPKEIVAVPSSASPLGMPIWVIALSGLLGLGGTGLYHLKKNT